MRRLPVPEFEVDEGDLRLISGLDLFEPLSSGEIERLARRLPVQGFEVGRHVYTPAYRGEMFFLLLQGRIRVYKMEEEREITLAIIGAGEMFGEAAFTARRRKGSYAEVLSPSRVAPMSRGALQRLVHDNPAVGMKAMELLGERLSQYEDRMADIGLKGVSSRLARLLLELSQTEGVVTSEGRKIPTHYSHEQLGAMIGAKRVAVTRALTGLRETGAVEVYRRRIHIQDVEALRRATI